MKTWKAFMVAGLMLSCGFLQADYDLDDASTKNIADPEEQAQGSPFKIRFGGDWLNRAKFDDDEASGHLRYTHAEAEFDAIVWYNPCCQEGLQLGLSYEFTKLDWHDNPYFERKNYDTAVISLNYFTHRVCDWFWIASMGMNIDTDKWNLTDYATYDMTVWGRYQYCENIGINVGIYAETGMKLDRVLPILGFDIVFSPCWKLNAVFPMNMALVYTVDEKWAISLAGRVFSDRHRAGRKGEIRRAVWRYSNFGIELAVDYNMCNWLVANIHGGYATGGHLKIANHNSHHSRRLKFDGSTYVGGELAISF